MPRENDPSLTDDLRVLRRIPRDADRITWDDRGQPLPSSSNFKDSRQELSLYLESECRLEEVMQGHIGFGVVRLTIRDIRETCGDGIVICRDEVDPANGHILVCGRITGGMAKRLQRAATWHQTYWPSPP
jgi:hypothetical protein